ncbi:hypothetical protein SLA2020_226620 [Shorea laevis]
MPGPWLLLRDWNTTLTKDEKVENMITIGGATQNYKNSTQSCFLKIQNFQEILLLGQVINWEKREYGINWTGRSLMTNESLLFLDLKPIFSSEGTFDDSTWGEFWDL